MNGYTTEQLIAVQPLEDQASWNETLNSIRNLGLPSMQPLVVKIKR